MTQPTPKDPLSLIDSHEDASDFRSTNMYLLRREEDKNTLLEDFREMFKEIAANESSMTTRSLAMNSVPEDPLASFNRFSEYASSPMHAFSDPGLPPYANPALRPCHQPYPPMEMDQQHSKLPTLSFDRTPDAFSLLQMPKLPQHRQIKLKKMPPSSPSLVLDTSSSPMLQQKRKRRNFTDHPPNSMELEKVQMYGCQNRFTSEQINTAAVIPKRALNGDVPCYHLLPCPVHGVTRHSQRSHRDLSLKCLECMSVNTWLWSKRQRSEEANGGDHRRGQVRGPPSKGLPVVGSHNGSYEATNILCSEGADIDDVVAKDTETK